MVIHSYLSTQHDIDVLVRGMRLASRLAHTEPLRSLIDQDDRTPELDHSLLDADDETLAKEVRARADTVYHPTSTARIGAVVDARLRVYGLEGLRIADCSVFPTIVSGHTVRVFVSVKNCADLCLGIVGTRVRSRGEGRRHDQDCLSGSLNAREFKGTIGLCFRSRCYDSFCVYLCLHINEHLDIRARFIYLL